MPRGAIVLVAVSALALAIAVPRDAFQASGSDQVLDRPRARVLVVQSYDAEYVWTQSIQQGLAEGLRDLPVVFETFYMDAKRNPSADHKRDKAQQALALQRRFDPDVVVTVDDAAMEFFAAPHLKGLSRPQVVFCGLNAPPERYGVPAPNISGVREHWHFREGFALLKRIVPSARRVVLMVEDTEVGGYVVNDMRQDLAKAPFALTVAEVDRVSTFQQWQELLKRHQQDADAIALGIYHSLRDERTGRVVPPGEVAAWTNSVNMRPTLGFADYSLEHGALCGVLESGHEQGFLAGMLVRQVLEGTPAGNLPMRSNEQGLVMINTVTAERLKVDIPFEIIEAADIVLH